MCVFVFVIQWTIVSIWCRKMPLNYILQIEQFCSANIIYMPRILVEWIVILNFIDWQHLQNTGINRSCFHGVHSNQVVLKDIITFMMSTPTSQGVLLLIPCSLLLTLHTLGLLGQAVFSGCACSRVREVNFTTLQYKAALQNISFIATS